MVATSQPLAVAAGLEILRQGGNAADAAVAAVAALFVTEPTTSGIGGDLFALYYEADSARITALNASGRSPQALTLSRLKQEGFEEELPRFHPYTITVPGACSGMCELSDRYGSLALQEVLKPAVEMAEEGYPVAPVTAFFWKRGVEKQLQQALHGEELTITGRAPYSGEIFRNPGLAQTLKAVAERGEEVFYEGEIAEAIVAVVDEAGGCLTQADLAAHQATWEEPIHVNYRGYRVWECPPNGQGLTALLALNILEGFEVSDLQPDSVERLHLQIEAMRLAFADCRWHISDPAFRHIPLQQLLSKTYADQRRQLMDPEQATVDQVRGTPHASSDTVYLTVVDGEGNACSLINSNYMGFGTGIVPQGWGFTLQNRGHNFSLDPAHPNALAPEKRPYHTIIPGMITYPVPSGADGQEVRDRLFSSFGVMGGFMQPQGHLQVVCSLIDDHLDPQAALDRPRFCITDGQSDGRVALEEGLPVRVMAELAAMGHDVKPVSGYRRAVFGRGQIILQETASDVLWGGSDPRADGCAMTL